MLSGQLFLSALQAISQSNSSLVHSHTGDTPFPGLPVTSAPASASYWAAHNHASRNHLIGYGKNDELPSHSDVVMCGGLHPSVLTGNVHVRFTPALGPE